jgi:hypothetical protein
MADIVDAEADRLDDVLFHLVEGRIELGLARLDAAGRKIGLVEIAGKAHQRRITFRAHRLDNRTDLVDEAGKIGFGPAQQPGAAGLVEAGKIVEGDVGHGDFPAGVQIEAR